MNVPRSGSMCHVLDWMQYLMASGSAQLVNSLNTKSMQDRFH